MNWYGRWVNRLGLTNRPRIRKLIVGIIGGTVVLFGLALVVLPGPAVVVVPLGLALLATEFAWARRLIKRGGDFWGRARRWKRRQAEETGDSLGHDSN
ncbi:MAG: PGPGW domain-containing protein [Verrucomicrobiota bacterium]|nr:PGPGW domain-containing protein [Verrucomicrobiota bacterium]